MALQARARIAPNGWRLPWGLRKSGISASTSISGRVCGTIGVAPAKCFGSCEGVPCHGSLTWGKTLYGSAPTSCQLLLRKLNDPAPSVTFLRNVLESCEDRAGEERRRTRRVLHQMERPVTMRVV